ncbi:MAG: hypothetical protein K1X75_13755 [Leptospirales bacterium]|nr:hypothetical protein [Leptospirales bacterium]
MSVATGQIFLRGAAMGPLIQTLGQHLVAWSRTEACLEDFEENDSAYFSTANSLQKARLTLLLPGANGVIALLDSSSFWFDRELAQQLSAELQCDACWFALSGDSLSLDMIEWQSGTTLQTIQSPASVSPPMMPFYQDVEQLAFERLLEFGVLPEYIFLRLNHLEPISPQEMPDSETPFLFQLVRGSENFDLYASPYRIRLPDPPPSGMLGFPDRRLEDNRIASDHLQLSGEPEEERLDRLYAALLSRAERYRMIGWRETSYRVQAGIGRTGMLKALQQLQVERGDVMLRFVD